MPRRVHASRFFKRRLEHLCDVYVYADADGAQGTGGYGGGYGSSPLLDEVVCLFSPLAHVREVQMSQGVVLVQFRVFTAYSALIDTTAKAGWYRVLNVRDAAGAVFAAGPLACVGVRDPGGRHHHLEFDLTTQEIPIA